MGYHVLVLAGGSGTRLWPLSREALPKHLLPLGPGGTSLLRATVERVLPLSASVHVVTAESQVEACAEALEGVDLPADWAIAEPQARGTGPALGLAVRWILDSDPDAVISSVHADHHIDDADAYRASVLAAAGWAAQSDGLATVGLRPTYPATGFGYVALAAPRPAEGAWSPPSGSRADAATLAAATGSVAHHAAGFVEKPPLEVAEGYLRDGRHLWNTGLFAWPGARFWAELEAADPQLATALTEVAASRRAGDEPAAAAAYAALKPVAVEPLVFERTPQLTVVEAGFGWSDLGSFADLYAARRDEGDADAEGNVTSGDVLAIDARNSLVLEMADRRVVLVDVDGLVVVDTGDAVLVTRPEASQRVKEVVDRLRAEGAGGLL